MKPRSTTLFNPVIITLITSFSLLLIILFISMFGPIEAQLWLLKSYRADGGKLGFEAGDLVYTIDIEDRKVVGIKALNASLLDGDENASIMFHYERAYYNSHAATIELSHNDQEDTCTYDFSDPWTGVTCDDIQLTEAESEAIEDRLDIYRSIIERHFHWSDIPERNRP